MTFNIRDLKDGHLPLVERIDEALRRVKMGQGPMRVPVEATDVDVVLYACRDRIVELEAQMVEAQFKVAAWDAREAYLHAPGDSAELFEGWESEEFNLRMAEKNAELAEAREVSKRYEDRYFAVQAVIATLMANDRVYTLCASLMDDGELRTLNEFLCDTKADAEAQP